MSIALRATLGRGLLVLGALALTTAVAAQPGPASSAPYAGPSASQDPCRQTEDCRDHGQCTAMAGECVAARAADCRASTACAEDGECLLQPEWQQCSDGTRHRSTGATIAGAVALSLGGASLITGALDLAITGSDFDCDETICRVSAVAIITGGVAMAAGIGLLIYGAPYVSDEEAVAARSGWVPAIRVGPGGGSLTWRF